MCCCAYSPGSLPTSPASPRRSSLPNSRRTPGERTGFRFAARGKYSLIDSIGELRRRRLQVYYLCVDTSWPLSPWHRRPVGGGYTASGERAYRGIRQQAGRARGLHERRRREAHLCGKETMPYWRLQSQSTAV
ncbi:hypothetical protein DPEC_G00185680 [Dallia pectoralis]|uniref:Uncharacterized protein n=1 Tax=Dallia pectoralis TaxID=75939 RepID=A0ACC2GBB2_DALPE|nr:hypothetical protein DPEC_G00185680 [Dallia pectoralis]